MANPISGSRSLIVTKHLVRIDGSSLTHKTSCQFRYIAGQSIHSKIALDISEYSTTFNMWLLQYDRYYCDTWNCTTNCATKMCPEDISKSLLLHRLRLGSHLAPNIVALCCAAVHQQLISFPHILSHCFPDSISREYCFLVKTPPAKLHPYLL